MAAKVTWLRTAAPRTLRSSADAFLDTIGSANTRRAYGIAIVGESGAGLLELVAKSRHRKAENLRRYFKPSPQAMRELTAILGPGAGRRR
ncbi:hypothetical protein [Nocardia carnea]|uniref:hypothetical protein n=1 Tax=Nocardia carnea TaxID=37328 RepID=UPI002453E438|nr:hypothetical protein [Nocardia carnea]